MYYECPECGSLKVPKTISFFPPKIVICLDCSKKGIEKEFIKKEEYRHKLTPLPQSP